MLAYAITTNGACLHLLVSPLAMYRFFFYASCLANITACTAVLEKSAHIAAKKGGGGGGGAIFMGLR